MCGYFRSLLHAATGARRSPTRARIRAPASWYSVFKDPDHSIRPQLPSNIRSAISENGLFRRTKDRWTTTPGPRPGTRARLSPADGAQACAVASTGRSDRTPSGSRPLRPPVRTTSGTSYTAGGARSICPFPEAAVGKLNSRNPGASWITIPPPQSARERRRVDHYAAAGWITRRAPLKLSLRQCPSFT